MTQDFHPGGTGARAESDEIPVAAGVDPERGFYYNLSTGEVEQGLQSSWTQRMGPYPTREAAQHALETAHRRTEAWDDDDRAWRGE